MNSHPHPRNAAFTLVELLTVITIIAILMGLLFPAINIAKDQARKAEARTAVTGIAAAVKSYYTEYGKYPLGQKGIDNAAAPQDVMFGDGTNKTSDLFNILRNIGPGMGQANAFNPRAIVFFDGKTASDPASPKSGFVPNNTTSNLAPGAYIDPWGNEYRIAIDGDYDNHIANLPYTDFQGTNAPVTGVCVFSIGKDSAVGDKKMGPAYRNGSTISDDIISWQ
jgi:prepilin-type N-terminal cleavage/methylation domain-containing protein